MQSISQAGFKNSPIVSQELIKFLAKKTNVEAIDRLSGELLVLRTENNKLRHDVKELQVKVKEATTKWINKRPLRPTSLNGSKPLRRR